MTYTEQNLSMPAKRENNKKRTYLVVNPLQGKHVPTSPGEALRLFGSLADMLAEEYADEPLLLVGFAETATAIGAVAAGRLGALYIQTTREELEGVEFFYFSEQHSHAEQQKLVKTDLDRVAGHIRRVIFIEDEITTGNTILHLIDVLEKAYPERFCFSAASILNGMDADCSRGYEARGVRLHYLVRTDHSGYEEQVSVYRGDGEYYACNTAPVCGDIGELKLSGRMDARRLVQGDAYKKACEEMCMQAVFGLQRGAGRSLLVLGTEEFMYPALCLADMLEKAGNHVRCHSTTRSPIAVSTEETYPLHRRYELASFYDPRRRTFIYDLEQYDMVVIVTDAEGAYRQGLYSLVHALRLCRNSEICLARWC